MTHTDIPNYPPAAVAPMRDELTAVGFKELLDVAQVDEAVKQSGTSLFVINSVCGCSAGSARPGVALALQHIRIPDQLYTVFAGMEKSAVARLREHMGPIPPSSPFFALMKDGEVIWTLQRHEIERSSATDVATSTVGAFEQHCTATGPSISPDRFDQLGFTATCGCSL